MEVHTNTNSVTTDAFLDQKRVNICGHAVKMVSFPFLLLFIELFILQYFPFHVVITEYDTLTLIIAFCAVSLIFAIHSRATSRVLTATSNGVHILGFCILRIHSNPGCPPTCRSTTAPIMSRLPFCRLPRSIESADYNRKQ